MRIGLELWDGTEEMSDVAAICVYGVKMEKGNASREYGSVAEAMDVHGNISVRLTKVCELWHEMLRGIAMFMRHHLQK